MATTTPTWKRAQTNTAGTLSKDRTSAGPRPDGGAGGEVGDARGIIPVGGIVMWAGAFADVPQGWHLCDGDEGTVDLTDRFVLGTNTELELGDVGGAKKHRHNLIAGDTPAGTATVVAATAGTPAGTVDSGGAHTHGFTSSANAATPDLLAPDVTGTGVAASGTTASDGAHTHTFTGTELATHTHLLAGKTALGESEAGDYGDNDTLPPWFKLAFIQRIF